MKLVNASLLLSVLFGIALFSQSCGGDNGTGSIPHVNVSMQIDLNDPTFIALNPYGGYVYLDNHGNKGLILIHNYDDTYSAFDRICSYEPSSACARIEMESSGLYMQCGATENGTFIPCCGSKFDLQGFVLDGAATYPLQQYPVYINGNILTIRN